MHILPTTSASLDDLIEPVDLCQSPADVVALSFTDSDLAALAAAWKRGGAALPSMRLAALRDLRHPMSVDLWAEKVGARAKIILVRLLGGYDWWRYGCDQLAALARANGIRLALLPGECREQDERLVECSTLPREELDALLAFFREGGPGNMDALVRRLAALARGESAADAAVAVPKAGWHARLSPLEGEMSAKPTEGVGRGSARLTLATGREDPTRPLRGHPPLKGEGWRRLSSAPSCAGSPRSCGRGGSARSAPGRPPASSSCPGRHTGSRIYG